MVREFLRLHLKDLDDGLVEQLIAAPGASNPFTPWCWRSCGC